MDLSVHPSARRLRRRNPILGEDSEGAVEAPSESLVSGRLASPFQEPVGSSLTRMTERLRGTVVNRARGTPTIVWLAIVAGTVLPASASADVVQLTTGKWIEGTVKGVTARGLVIEVAGRETTIEQRQILGITFDAASPAPPVGPPDAPTASDGAPVAARPAAEPAAPPPATSPTATEATGAGRESAPPAAEGTAAAPPPPGSPGADESPAASTEPEPPAAAPPAVASAATPPPAPPRPEISLAEISLPSLREAMRALIDLRARAESSVSHEDYVTLTDEARARVERYLADPVEKRADLKKTLASAMRLYALASSAWSAFDAKSDLAAIGRDPTIDECPRLRQVIEQDAADWNIRADDPAFAGLIAGTEGIPDLWACASDRIEHARKLLAERKP